jgi:hypothetical protein
VCTRDPTHPKLVEPSYINGTRGPSEQVDAEISVLDIKPQDAQNLEREQKLSKKNGDVDKIKQKLSGKAPLKPPYGGRVKLHTSADCTIVPPEHGDARKEKGRVICDVR